jgi:hypothetical protein
MQPQPLDIIDLAQRKLDAIRDRVTQQRESPWQPPGNNHTHYLSLLKEVTQLKVDDDRAGCEVAYKAIEEARTDLALPTRLISAEAERLSSLSCSLDVAAAALVDFYLDRLPRPLQLGENSPSPVLGNYFGEQEVISARVEVYWARVGAYCRWQPHQLSPAAVSKIVMIHELAHYFTHQGEDAYGGRWLNYEAREKHDVVEIVTQMATEDVLQKLNDDVLKETFEVMLSRQSPAYTEHRKIRAALVNTYGFDEENIFWNFFKRHIRPNDDPALDTVAGLYKLIDRAGQEHRREHPEDSKG